MAALHDLELHSDLLRATDKLGFIEATPVQEKAIPAILTGRDLQVSAQTGSGKTAAFLLPLLHQMLAHQAPNTSSRALILLPTRELALQTKKTFEELAAFTYIKCGLVIGGEAFKHQVATLRKNPEVLIATPGRLVEHIEKGTTDFSDLEILVLDEADRMLDMGFAVDMNTIADNCHNERQNLLFSATLGHRGMDSINNQFKNPLTLKIQSSQFEKLSQQRILADDIDHKQQLLEALIAEEQPEKCIVFCKTRVQCQQVSNRLRAKKIKAAYIHGELSQSERKQVMNRFRQGSQNVLVATDLAARGLDIVDVELVINFHIAPSGDEHIHRVGRTARAGSSGKAINLVTASEWNGMSSIERYLKIRFEERVLPGLKARYSGPGKIKKSGKAAGKKKRPGKKPPTRKKTRSASRVTGDGFNAMRRKK